jgi:acetyltransferase
MLLFGAGGTAVEVLRDTSLALPPLDLKLARDLMQRTRVFRLLEGYRDQPPADLDAIALTLVKTSQLVTDLPEVRELDINPLLADDRGVIALDARVRVADEAKHPRHPMALRPYPVEWMRRLDVPSLGGVELRPIRPDDEALYEEFFRHVSATDARMRFFTPMRRLSHAHRARLTQIDYAREMAFVAVSADSGELLGVSRLVADPDYTKAEYGVQVRSDLKAKGLGWRLMQHLIAYARHEKLEELYGEVLATNTTMLQMCTELGFRIEADKDDLALRKVHLKLGAKEAVHAQSGA